ncbi:MAG: HlyD family efflux transporter periplasmic adaptor subunit [Candidatus Abyssobacteria bacterium SURF_5]|uniref:HlyD family efflux transporter periplasmic adaptor subunit n=1 Tax=Abyssobacteria bacterium (strain SURF_5) TaxID=2093360 RepID=A0A3A4P124_ABYX5|nr:MAG: HlyD family efflux transporter periplasmic adaptor subunit [Candidatus Abyssubacteria bacterium SURF_5]
MRTKKIRVLILLVLVSIGSVVAISFIPFREEEENAIRISGNIEATDIAASFKIAGRLEERLVSEGEMIGRDQPVARLEQTELLQEAAMYRAELASARAALAELEAGSRPEEIAKAEAAVNKAEANLAALIAGSRRQEIAAARAVVDRARAEAARLKSDFARQEYLYENGISSDREFDAAKTAYEMAEARVKESVEQMQLVEEGPRQEEIDAAQAALVEAREQYNLVKKGPRIEVIEQARARVERAEQAFAIRETKLAYTNLRSPLTGIVLSEQAEPGEYVNAGSPIIVVGDLENVWLRGYVNETDLGRVKPGQSVRVTADTYPGKVYNGTISFISSEAEFTPKNIQTQEQRVKLVYRVKIDISNPRLELKPGMPADAQILLGGA